MRFDEIVYAIEEALKKECYLPALALALVIPDICAKYDYPEIYNGSSKENRGNGTAYAKWYDEKIRYYEFPNAYHGSLMIRKDDKDNPKRKMSELTGSQCWKLRCELLHGLYIDLDKKISDDNKVTTYFNFIVSKNSTYFSGGVSYSQSGQTVCVDVNLPVFIENILFVFKQDYLSDHSFLEKAEKTRLCVVNVLL